MPGTRRTPIRRQHTSLVTAQAVALYQRALKARAKADVSDAKAVRGMFDAAEATFGGVDVLINNAGIMKLARIADSDDAAFDRQIAVIQHHA